MFINYSNHPSKTWSEEQLAAAKKYGEIYDVGFPDVSVLFTEKEIELLAENQLEILKNTAKEHNCDLNQVAIMCQGEFSLTYAVLRKIKANFPNCKAVCAVSKREVVEEMKDGYNIKIVQFRFCGFREYL